LHGKPSRPLSDYRALAELRYPVRLFITRADILRAHDEDPAGAMSLLEAGSRKLIVTYRDETLHEAAKLLRNNIGRLRVVDGKDRCVVGYLGRPGKQISLRLNFG